MALEGRVCKECGQPVVETTTKGWIHVLGVDDDLPRGWSDHDAVPAEEGSEAETYAEPKSLLLRQTEALERIAGILEEWVRR